MDKVNNHKHGQPQDHDNNENLNNNHHHGKTGYNHSRELPSVSKKRLWIAFYINFIFLILEIIGGFLSNSLALLADAGHMLTDVSALGLAIFVAHLAESLPTPKRTFGLLRAEVLGAFLNGTVLVIIVGMIFWGAWRRMGSLQEINGPLMLVVAVLGLLANAGSAWVLYKDRNRNVNIKGAYLHMMADTLGSTGAITAGVVILITGWTPIDQIVSIIIGMLILLGSWELLTQTVNILLEATPEDIDYDEVNSALKNIEHVKDVHDLHIWTISSGIPALSAHIELCAECGDTKHWQLCLKDVQKMLREHFGINHTTLQFEPEDFEREPGII